MTIYDNTYKPRSCQKHQVPCKGRYCSVAVAVEAFVILGDCLETHPHA